MFEKIELGFVLLYGNGFYASEPLYRLDNLLFAKRGGAYLKLAANGQTGIEGVEWRRIDMPDNLDHEPGPDGYLIVNSPVATP